MPKCNHGDVLDVSLDPSIGKEYMKTRPCLVVQSDLLNRHSQTTIVAPITGAENTRGGPTYVRVRKGEAGLPKDSLIVCHQLRTVDESRLGRVHGQARPETMLKVAEALRTILAM